MIHLAYVTMKLAPFDEGGPSTAAYYLLKNLIKTKCVRITLIVGDSATEKDITNTFGDQFENIIRISTSLPISMSMHLIIQKMKEIWQAFDYIDIMHVNALDTFSRNFFLPYITFIRKKPSIVVYHSTPTPEIQGFFYGWKARVLLNIVWKAAQTLHEPFWSKIVVVSQFVKRMTLKKGVNEERVCLIHNGIDLDEINKAPRLDLEGDIKLLFVGKIKQVKGIDLLLKAISTLDLSTKEKIKLYIAGSGPYEKNYKSLARSLKVSKYVQFLGHLPLSKCFSLYKSCDILILPSRLEGFPITLLEALGSGIPIIATSVGGITEIVKNNRNGLLVGLNTREITQKIKFLVDHPEVRKQFSKNNLMDAEKYSWQKIAQQYLNLYKSLV